MGAHLFVQFACAARHGQQGVGGVSKYVPALKPIGKSLTVKSLTTIITHGLGESENPKRPYMPVWGPVISKSQVADLVADIRAGLPKVRYATPVPVPRSQGPAVAGQALYARYAADVRRWMPGESLLGWLTAARQKGGAPASPGRRGLQMRRLWGSKAGRL
jgi:hypothetical protein